ncbi:MAG: KilA-N domain-containing protein, partial [Candidatus Parabeggiatoa sp.]|nr:KilA-N domain-containing protein [Candidatus Parabeggiatoa sp.]
MTTQLISRDFHGATIRQRSSDGYLCATDMCQATSKLLADYKRLKSTKEYFNSFSSDMGIPISNIIQVVKGVQKGKTAQDQGTWIHPYASIHLAIWCNPDFAVMVTKWTFELLTKGSVSLDPRLEIALFAQAKAEELDKLGITGNARQIALNNAIKQQFDCDMLQLFGIESQVAEIQQALLIPTEIAKRIGLKSARPVNVKLIEFGLQTKHRDEKKRLYY